jgi:putative hydrolase of the HAD superfamily
MRPGGNNDRKPYDTLYENGVTSKMIRAIVFDFDGLILDTETQWYHSVREVYESLGAELPIQVFGRGIGTHGAFDLFQYLEECIGRPVDRDHIRNTYQARQKELMKTQKALPGVEDYLHAAKDLGLRVALASSSNREWIEGHLNHHNLLDHFEVIRTRDDVAKVKPDPELYLRALEDLGVAPEEAIAFEDSPNGALAAKRAGMHCVVVPNFVTSQLEFGEHDLRLESMAEMELAALIAHLEEKQGAAR